MAKNDRICKKLRLKPGDRVVEIGTGWGGFAVHAAQNYGLQVTATTISNQQHEFAEKRFRHAGLESQVLLLKKDYRDLTGESDKLVSIEMIEAVGHPFYKIFFQSPDIQHFCRDHRRLCCIRFYDTSVVLNLGCSHRPADNERQQ